MGFSAPPFSKHSILNKLPRELRDNIYDEYFKGARIQIVAPPPNLNGSPAEASIYYGFFGDECALVATCRAIKAETAAILWRNAVCEATDY